MENKSNVTVKGIGFFGLLTILFIALKLIGVIAWSWVAVLAPLWIPLVIKLVLVVVLVIVALIADRY